MEEFANDGGMFPKQIWPLHDAGHMKFGEPAGSAVPLCWAHAEYVTLVHSRHVGHPLDRVPEAWERYVLNPPPLPRISFWTLAHQTMELTSGSRLMILIDAPTRVRWKLASHDNWQDLETVHLFQQLFGIDLGVIREPVEFRIGDGNIHLIRVRTQI
jgi:glucoamylase